MSDQNKNSACQVMVVDDSEFVARLMSKMLDGTEFSVIGHAKNGQEALSKYQELKPEIVTMDIIMPNMNGIEAITELFKIDQNAKVLVVSAMGHDNVIQQAMDLGAKHYILKPFQKDDFLRAVQVVKNAV
jgi:two-component system chemotaxis response regulator CheY